jgi:diguanylate cyclase (GGDEF)-like protein
MNERFQVPGILIVSAAQRDVNALRSVLKDDYAVRSTASAEKALKIMASKNRPDLVLLDTSNKEMDGSFLCEKIKADPNTWNTPVLGIIDGPGNDNETSAFKMGATDYIAKPFNPDVVKARVRTLVEVKKYRETMDNSFFTDGLTAIANRRRFDEYYESVWNISVREYMPLALILICVDNFEELAMNRGYQAGDDCIIRIAKKLSSQIKRRTDLLARYGREEFICILPGVRIDGAITIAEQFRAGVYSLMIPSSDDEAGGYATISQGIATVIPTRDMVRQTLVDAAVEALGKSRSAGGRGQINCRSL